MAGVENRTHAQSSSSGSPDLPRHADRIPPIVAVVGATAAGKSGLSLELASQLGGEIVNTDAMQLYRGMDIGTAKLAPSERRGVPHHLLDVLEVTEPATVADFQERACALIDDLRGRDTPVVLVGGSALYTRAVTDQLEFPGTDAELRDRWETELERVGGEALHDLLRARDPEAAARIQPANGRRVVRALEVIELTGRPFSASLPQLRYARPATIQIGVDIDRPTLHARIEQRVSEMFRLGLVEEVRELQRRGLARGRTASKAIGYREVAAHLAGELSEAEAAERIVIATRRFARRQEGWFRKDPRIHWVRFDDPGRVGDAMAAIRAVQRSG